MKTKTLHITTGEHGEKEVIPISFSDKEYKLFGAFHEKALNLLNLELFQRGIPSRLQVSWDKKLGLKVDAELPKDDDICSLLHRLRPFILQGEDTFFPAISNLLSKNIQNTQVRGLISEARDVWVGQAISSQLQVTMTMVENYKQVEQKILSDEFLIKWLNAYEYHSDIEKKSYIEALHKFYPLPATKVLLLGMLIEKVKAISRLNEFIVLILCNEPQKTSSFVIGNQYIATSS